jgi:threonine dehydrogenase-like Zn-dependent dehydrogenase
MRAVHVRALSQVVATTRNKPSPGPGEVLIALTYAGVCGSDTHAVAGHHPLLIPPYFPGHEATGRVVKVGEQVGQQVGQGVDDAADQSGRDSAGSRGQAWAPGQRVILKPNVACGQCVNCRAGRTNACQTLAWIGCDSSGRLPGAMAEYFVAPATNLFAVPDTVSDEAAALVECLSTPVHAVRIAGDISGGRAVVIGGGTIGLFAVIAARLAGAGRIAVTDLDPAKLARALRHGADQAVDAAAPDAAEQVVEALGGPADIVFDCVANEDSTRQAFRLLRHAGKLMVVGVPPREFTVPMPYLQDWEIAIQGCANYTAEDIDAAIAIAARGELPASEVVSQVYSIDEATAAFAAAALNSSGKVLIRP